MSSVVRDMDEGVMMIRFDPGENGLLDAKGAYRLLEAINGALGDDAVLVIVLTGARPGVFIRHFDVASILQSAVLLRNGSLTQEMMADSSVAQLYETLAAARKPVIAAINGACMGGGYELALCCTLRIAGSDVSEIGLPETRLGILPGGGGTQRLPRLLGTPKALRLILDGAVLDAKAALENGLVDDIADDPIVAATAIARRWATLSPDLLSAAIELVRDAAQLPMEQGFVCERQSFVKRLCNDDAAMKVMARFLESGEDLSKFES